MEPQSDSSPTIPITVPSPPIFGEPPPADPILGEPPPADPISFLVNIPCIPCTDISQMQEPVIEFGIRGGIPPHTVKIFADGHLTVEGAATIRTETLAPLTVKALIQLANAINFWILPEFSGVQGQNPATDFVQITLPCTSRRVEVTRFDTDGSFAEFYSLLSELVGVSRF